MTTKTVAGLAPDDGRDIHLEAGVALDSMVARLDRLDAAGVDPNFVVGALAALVSDDVWDEAITTAMVTGGEVG